MCEITRREALGRVALTVATLGAVDRAAAHEVHRMAAQAASDAGGIYTPSALSAHEYATLKRLADLVIPVEDGRPGALAAAVPAWIDLLLGLNDKLKEIYVRGLAWIDGAIKARGGRNFVSAPASEQTALLDLIAYSKNASPELDPGIEFFVLARQMTVDGFYTSRIGMRDIYLGNKPAATFTVPREAIDYALARSPLIP
jgi:gluconate 2-dehydrogenase gamma chain